MRLPALLLAPLLLALLAAPAAARIPRATADAVAAAVEANYYDATRGAAIAAELRAAAAAGAFDAHTAPLDLATALGAALAPHDGHFDVRWSPPDARAGADAPRRRGPPPARGHGIRAVRVLPGNLGLLDLAYFADFDFADRTAPARTGIDAALVLLQGADAVIVDVRDNGGGSPAMVGYLTSAFVPAGADVYNTFVRRDGRDSEAPREEHPSPRLQVPLYVLTSGRTGSAAEALAYTLQSAGRATVVGERSAGAANPGGPVDAGDGFRVFVSDGSPVNPRTGTNWEGTGVVPDVAVPAHDALRAAQVHALQALAAAGDADPGRRWVLAALQATAAADPDAAAYAGGYGELRIERRDDTLLLHQGRRPPRTLRALGGGVFFVEEDPLRRVAFTRDPAGDIDALELQFADGGRSRYRRDGR